MPQKDIKIGFFGTPEYAVMTLETLKRAGFDIVFIVTTPDRPSGRKMIITPPPVKVWGESHNIPVLQPEKLRDPVFAETLKSYNADVFIVMAYGKIIPEDILNIPPHKSLNIHPSLLPKFRGSCPIETAILEDEKNTGVSIIRMDKEMDHGPIIASKKVSILPWPPRANVLGRELVQAGTELLVSVLPDWTLGKIQEKEQDHSRATYTTMIKKEDGKIDLNDNPYKNFLKIQAYHGWPSAYFFKDGKRIKITEASFTNDTLHIEKVIPENGKEIDYSKLV